MRFIWNAKDGGPESRVWCWGIESKRFGSVLLLKFGRGSREAYHTHAFNSTSWLLRGGLDEYHAPTFVRGYGAVCPVIHHFPSPHPIRTYRDTYHMVSGVAENNWVFTLRGPWIDKWREWHPRTGRRITLAHGRKEVA